MRNAVLAALGAVLLLSGCGDPDKLDVAATNARLAVSQNEAQTNRIEELESTVSDLESRLEELEYRLEE